MREHEQNRTEDPGAILRYEPKPALHAGARSKKFSHPAYTTEALFSCG
jgi:hypothetical protein